MRYANWLTAAAVGASLSMLSTAGSAQVRTGITGDEELPKGKALGVAGDNDAPRGKGFATGRDAAKTGTKLPERRAATEERHESRRIPVINASATFRSTQLIGTNITDADGRAIGKVVDFVSDGRGNVLYPVISYSGSPGFTGKLFAVPSTALSFTSGDNNTTTAQFAFDPSLLKNAPSFSSLRFPDFSNPAVVNEIKSFYTDLLAKGGNGRAVTPDPSVPANGPGDRVQTQAQANTPTLPVDPTLPANGPGDRPATVNPALPNPGTPAASSAPSATIPGTTGTENAGFPAASSSTTPGTDLSSPITSTRTATTKDGNSIVGRTGSPASSSLPGATVVGRTGSPASESDSNLNTGDAAAQNRLMLRSSQMLGMAIHGQDGQAMGKVVDFVGDSNGTSQFAVVSLGTDKRNIVVPFNALNFQAGPNGTSVATLRLAPNQLRSAPSFTGNQWPNFTDSTYTTQVSKFYSGLLPTPGASKGYVYGQFPGTSTDGTKFPERAATHAPGAPHGAAPRPGASGPRVPSVGPGVPGVPSLPGGRSPAPGAAPGTPGVGGAKGGAAPGAGGAVPGTPAAGGGPGGAPGGGVRVPR